MMKRYDVITAAAFVLVDKDGNPRGALATDPAGAALLQLSDQKARTRLQAGVRSDGSAGFGILDDMGRERLTIDVSDDSVCLIQFSDTKGNKRFQLHTADDGTASLAIWNVSGKSPITAKTNADGTFGCTLDVNKPVRTKSKLRVIKPNESDESK